MRQAAPKVTQVSNSLEAGGLEDGAKAELKNIENNPMQRRVEPRFRLLD
jgi:hypothetical protein